MRTCREVSQSTRNKISQAVKQSHLKKTETQKQLTRAKQSASMLAYWQTIPKNDDDEPEVDYVSNW